MIKLIDVTKEFITEKNKKIKALDNVNITFPTRGFVSIVGKSGSGKSTLINAITGLVKLDQGHIIYDQLDSRNMTDNDYDNLRKNYFGIIFQGDYLFDDITVLDNLKLPFIIQNRLEDFTTELVDDILLRLDMQEYKHSKVKELSGGEKQRIAIARAIISDAKVIIADEVTSSLDEENTINVLEILKEISKERLVILITHDKENALKYSNQYYQLSYGKVIEKQDIEETEYETLSHYTSKTSFRSVLRLGKYTSNKQKFRYTFTVIFFTIALSVMMLYITFSTGTASAFIYRTIKENSDSRAVVSNYTVEQNYDKLEINECYNATTTINDFSGVNLDIPIDRYYGRVVFRQLEAKPIDIGTIILTDFSCDVFKYYQIIDFENYEQVIGQKLTINNIEVTISKCIITNYQTIDYDYSNDTNNSEFYNYRDNYLLIAQMNKIDIDYMFPTNNYFFANINNNEVHFQRVATANSSVVGDTPLQQFKEGQAIVGKGVIDEYFDVIDPTSCDYSQYLNKTISIDLNNGKSRILEIVGFETQQAPNSIVLMPKDFFDIGNNLKGNLSRSDVTGNMVYFTDKEQSLLLIEKLLENNKVPNVYRHMQMFAIANNIEERTINISLLIVALIFTIGTIYFHVSSLIKQNAKRTAIYSSCGLNKKQLIIIYQLDNIKLLIFASFISILVAVLVTRLLNTVIIKDTYFSPYVFRVWIYFAVLLVGIVLIAIFSYFPMQRLYKKDIKDIIYQK